MNVFDSSPAQNPLGDAYKKWRGLLMQANLLCMLVVFFSEVLMFFVFKATGTLTYSTPVYLLRFLLLPSVFYLLIALGGWFALRRLDERGRAINYVPIVQLTLPPYFQYHYFQRQKNAAQYLSAESGLPDPGPVGWTGDQQRKKQVFSR